MSHDWFSESRARIANFLNVHIGQDVSTHTMTSDMSPRLYHRLRKGAARYVLMEAAPDGHPQALVGHELGAFLNVQKILKMQGVRVPEVYAHDLAQGLILLEDLGERTVEDVLRGADDAEKRQIYGQLNDLLTVLRDLPLATLSSLPKFYDSRIYSFGRRFVDWFVPYYFDRPVCDEDLQAYFEMMGAIEAGLPDVPYGFVHGDFQPPNVMATEEGGYALLDFQGAMCGPSVYDLTNLLHDARRRVTPDLVLREQGAYFSDKKDRLSHWYSYMSLHFHLRVIGQFIRIAILSGKYSYLKHLDLLRQYLQENQNPIFKTYCKNQGFDFSRTLPDLDLERVKMLMREDAI